MDKPAHPLNKINATNKYHRVRIHASIIIIVDYNCVQYFKFSKKIRLTGCIRLQKIYSFISKLVQNNSGQSLVLALITLFSYGTQLPWLHLYIDDWIWAWTWEYYGAEGVRVYFSTNRPVWGLLYQLTLPLLDGNVLAYQIFALLCRFLASLTFFWFLRQIWPERSKVVFVAALLFTVYPGFALQPIAITYGHIFLVMAFLFLSLGLTARALQQNRPAYGLHALAGLLSILNLLMMEYFFTLEILRFFIIGLILFRTETNLPRLLVKTLRGWAFYGAILLSTILVRTFLLTQIQSNRYSFRWLAEFQAAPLQALGALLVKIAEDFWQTTFGAWLPALQRLLSLQIHLTSTAVTVFVALVVLAMAGLAWWFINAIREKRFTLEMIGLGVLAILAAGWPFWLTGLDVRPVEIFSRFTLPFMLGAALFMAGLITALPYRIVQSVLLAGLVGIAAGYHFQIANDFRLEWKYNQQLLWQIRWRIPDLEENTLLLLTDFPTRYYNLAALTTEINALYPYQPQPRRLAYSFHYSRNLDESLKGLSTGQTVTGRNVTARLEGSTDRLLAAQYDLGRCFRLTEPDLDGGDPSLPEHLQRASRLSDLRRVLTTPPDMPVHENWFGPEPQHTWCYYFEKADLARQGKKWTEVVGYWEEAESLGFSPRDEMEKMVFIEAFAQTGQWQKAADLALSFSLEERKNALCRLTQRIDRSTADSSAKNKFLTHVQDFAFCSSEQ